MRLNESHNLLNFTSFKKYIPYFWNNALNETVHVEKKVWDNSLFSFVRDNLELLHIYQTSPNISQIWLTFYNVKLISHTLNICIKPFKRSKFCFLMQRNEVGTFRLTMCSRKVSTRIWNDNYSNIQMLRYSNKNQCGTFNQFV